MKEVFFGPFESGEGIEATGSSACVASDVVL